MVSKKVVVTNKTGLHARPASNLVAFCKNYNSKIFLSNGEKKVSAASIIHVLTLGVKQAQNWKLSQKAKTKQQQ